MAWNAEIRKSKHIQFLEIKFILAVFPPPLEFFKPGTLGGGGRKGEGGGGEAHLMFWWESMSRLTSAHLKPKAGIGKRSEDLFVRSPGLVLVCAPTLGFRVVLVLRGGTGF